MATIINVPDKYHVIKSLADVSECHDFYLGKSRHGVYSATLDAQYWLQVWRFKESCAKMEWVLIHYRDLKPMRINYNHEHQKIVYSAINEEASKKEEIECNSDDDPMTNDDEVGVYGHRDMQIVGRFFKPPNLEPTYAQLLVQAIQRNEVDASCS
ncbi:hypothetical protein EJB05_05252, partial [Eragrostis curvula]